MTSQRILDFFKTRSRKVRASSSISMSFAGNFKAFRHALPDSHI